MAVLPAMLNMFPFLFLWLPNLSKAQFGPYRKLPLPSNVTGPEALAFDSSGLYTGVSGGRVLRFQDSTVGFVEFAVTSPNRPRALCDGTSDPNSNLGPTCGRPIGLGFYYQTGDLYIADAYFGLVVVGPNGGIATQLATSAEGVPFRFLDALDVDQGTGTVYFADLSAVFQEREILKVLLTGDRTGRFMKYDPKTNKVTVLLRDLAAPAGIAVSSDGTFVILSEAATGTIIRYWLQGPKANTSEIFARFPGQIIDNIKRNAKEEFWVAANVGIPAPVAIAVSSGIRLSNEGKVLQVLPINNGAVVTQSISEVQEFQGSLYLGSLVLPYVGVYGP